MKFNIFRVLATRFIKKSISYAATFHVTKKKKKKGLGRLDFQLLIVESSKHINLAGKCLLENKWMLYSVSL